MRGEGRGGQERGGKRGGYIKSEHREVEQQCK